MLEQKPTVPLLDCIRTVDTAETDSAAAAPTAAVPSRLATVASAKRIRTRVRTEITEHEC